MRIVFITSKLNFTTSGGSIEEIDFIIRTLQTLGHEVRVVTAYSSANHIPSAVSYPVIEEHLRSRRYLGTQWEAFQLLRKYEREADIFHIDAHLFMYGAGAYRMFHGTTPVVAFFNQFLTCWPQYVSRFFPQKKERIFRRLKKRLRWLMERHIGVWLANHIDFFSFVSPTLKGMYEEFGLKTGAKSMVIGDPIDIRRIMREHGITEDSYEKRLNRGRPVTIFYSSRMSPGKGFDMALFGFSKIKHKDRFRLILGGVGPEEPYIRKMVRNLKLEQYVDMPGWMTKKQLYEYYKTADIFLQADWWPAGTSISLLYAMAFGLPSIVPWGGGLQWNAGEGGAYFRYRDPEDLARTMERVGSDSELRLRLSRAALKRILFDEDMQYEKHIAELAERMNACAAERLAIA